MSAPARPVALATLMAGIALLALPFCALPPFRIGFWGAFEAQNIYALAVSTAIALLLAWRMAIGLGPGSLAWQLAAPAFALAAWALLRGIAAGTWRLALIGTPEAAYGTLWFVQIGLWILLAACLLRDGAGSWRWLLWAAALACIGVLGLYAYSLLSGQPFMLFLVLSYYAWPALALPLLALVFRPQGRHGTAYVIVALLLSAALLAMSRNATLIGAAAIGFGIAVLGPMLARRFAWLAHRGVMLAAVAVAALLPLLLVSQEALVRDFASLDTRRMAWLVTYASIDQAPLGWLFGLGWGQYTDALQAHVTAVPINLWDNKKWDFLYRGWGHSHNWLLQFLHDGGLPAVLLFLWLMLQPLMLAPPQRRFLALGFLAAYFIGLGLWFDVVFAAPYFVLAIVALALPWQAVAAPAVVDGQHRWLKPACMLLLALPLAWSAIVQHGHARGMTVLREWIEAEPPVPPHPPLPADPRHHDGVMAEFVRQHVNGLAVRARGPLDQAAEAQRIALLLDMVAERLPDTTVMRLPLGAARLFSEVMALPALAPFRPQVESRLALWRLAIERGLSLAPERSDVALGYLNWSVQSGRPQDALAMARQLRQRNPEDPIGLFFEGVVLTLEPDAAIKRQGVLLIQRAIAGNVERFFPLPEAFKAQIRSAG